VIRMETILHPTDLSESSKYALRYAVSLAEEYGAKLFIMHVIEEISQAMYFDMLHAPPLADLMAEIEEQVSKAMDELVAPEIRERVAVERIIRRGVPFLEVIRCAQEIGADLIVCGTHGRTGLKHVLFGSVAEKIVRKAPCPVLSVRHPEHRVEVPGRAEADDGPGA